MTSRNLRRRFNHLIGKHLKIHIPEYSYLLEQLEYIKNQKHNYRFDNFIRECADIYRIGRLLGMTDGETKAEWARRIVEKPDSYLYSRSPKPIRQDNKTYINRGQSGGSCYPKIRYPKKCRKTAWKRFYKLFPDLKQERNPNEKIS